MIFNLIVMRVIGIVFMLLGAAMVFAQAHSFLRSLPGILRGLPGRVWRFFRRKRDS